MVRAIINQMPLSEDGKQAAEQILAEAQAQGGEVTQETREKLALLCEQEAAEEAIEQKDLEEMEGHLELILKDVEGQASH